MLKDIRKSLVLVSFISITYLYSCVQSQKKSKEELTEKQTHTSEINDDSLKKDDTLSLSLSFRPHVVSLSNNHLTTKTINISAVEKIISKIESQLTDEKNINETTLAVLINAKRLKGDNLSNIVNISQKLILKIMSKGVDKELFDVTKLDIAISAIKNKKFSYAEYFIEDMLKTKNIYIKAAALTLQGIIYMYEKKIPEAVLSFNEALKINSDFEAAKLNLGFLALKYGDFDTALNLLGEMSSDWFVASGLIVLERHRGNYQKAKSLCDLILSQKQGYPPALFNCALNEWQGGGDLDKAISYLETFIHKKSAPSIYEDRAVSTLDKIQRLKATKGEPKKH